MKMYFIHLYSQKLRIINFPEKKKKISISLQKRPLFVRITVTYVSQESIPSRFTATFHLVKQIFARSYIHEDISDQRLDTKKVKKETEKFPDLLNLHFLFLLP